MISDKENRNERENVILISPPKKAIKGSKQDDLKAIVKEPLVSLKDHIKQARLASKSDNFEVILMKNDENLAKDVIKKNISDSKSSLKLKEKPNLKSSLKGSSGSLNCISSHAASVNDDDKWIDKQEKGFTEWINFTFSNAYSATSLEIDGTIQPITASSNGSDVSCLRMLLNKKNESKVRQQMIQIYHGQHFQNVMKSVELEIEENRMTMRDERDIHADLGLQDLLFDYIFSYDLQWLRFGLEIVFGKIITMPAKYNNFQCNNNDNKWKSIIKSYIFENLFTNVNITSKFTSKMLLYTKNEKSMKEQLRKYMLKNFLSLVLILDVSRISKNTSNITMLLPPSIFQLNSTIKSSKNLLINFCKNFLRNEGDIVRHLATFGYVLSFEQTYIDEYSFIIKNNSGLINDLKDGVKLARLVEILSSYEINISSTLRVPAVSRLQKLHNVGLVFKRLQECKVIHSGSIQAKDIVDGDKNKVIAFLWQVLYGYELRMLIDPIKVRTEVDEIYKNEIWRRCVYTVDEANKLAVNVPTVNNKDSIYNKHIERFNKMKETSSTVKSDIQALCDTLLEWCDSIAGQYDINVNDLTISLADGRVLCLLIHYYHPTILPLKMIKKTTSLENSSISAGQVTNEHRNFTLLKKACKEIGGIPYVLPSYDSKNIPDEKNMIVFLGYLFSRLTESSQQVRAAIRIQRLYRKMKGFMRIKRNIAAKSKKTIANATKNIKKVPTSTFRKSIIAKDVPVSVTISTYLAATIIKRKIHSYVQKKIYERNRLFVNVSKMEENNDYSILGYENKAILNDDVLIEGIDDDNMFGYQESDDNIDNALEVSRFITEEEHLRALEEEVQKRLLLEQDSLKKAVEEEVRRKFYEEEGNKKILEDVERKNKVDFDEEQRRQENEEHRREISDLITLKEQEIQSLLNAKEIAEIKAKQEEEIRIETERKLLQELQQANVKKDEERILLQEKYLEDAKNLEQQLIMERNARLIMEEKLKSIENEKIKYNSNIVTLQSIVRRYLSIKYCHNVRKSILLIQKNIRRNKAYNAYKRFYVSVCILQLKWRKISSKKMLNNKVNAANLIKKCYKKFAIRQKTLHRDSIILNETNKIILFNSKKNIIVRFFNGYLPYMRISRMKKGFARLIALYRSIKVRRQNRKSNSNVDVIYGRIVTANERARQDPSLTLAKRTVASLDVLQTGKMISHVLKSCQLLQLSTKVSEKCCNTFAKSGSSNILFGLIRSCNRSTPHQELLKYALIILLHVARHDNLASLVALSSESTDVLIDLMQMFRDKRSIFCLSCELLCRLISASKDIKNVCNNSEFRKRLEGLLHIMERKSRLDAKLKTISINKQSCSSPFSPTPKGNSSYLANSEPLICMQHLLVLLQ